MSETAPWHVYILRCADDSLYTGVAKNLEARLTAHNEGRGAKYTRGRRPVALVWTEPCADRACALRRELEIKRMPVAAKRELAATAAQVSESRKRRVKSA